MAFDYDFVIVGSGFGGSVNALRLAAAGKRVLVLERGRWWRPPSDTPINLDQFPPDATPYPRTPEDPWYWSPQDPQKYNGWVEFHFWPGMAVATGAGVGGGSLIYANVSTVPPRNTFESGWPAGVDWYNTLQPYYDTAGVMLNVQQLPDNQLTARYQLVKEGAEAIGDGDRFGKLDIAVTFSEQYPRTPEDPFDNSNTFPWVNAFGRHQGTCVHCGNCDVGCQVLAKNTLDLNYLAAAQQAGAAIQAMTQVSHVAPEEGGYRVYFDVIDAEMQTLTPGSVSGEQVILAAGSLGSTEILLRSRDQYGTLPEVSSVLGNDWSSNGDYLTFAFYKDREPPPSPTWGPTITCHINYLEDVEGPQYTIEDGGVPPAGRNWLVQTLTAAEHDVPLPVKVMLEHLVKRITNDDEAARFMPWFANGRDASNGRLFLNGKEELTLDWNVTDSIPVFDAEINRQIQLAEATGGEAHVPLAWKWFKWIITPHPLGGSPMGETVQDGVVDQYGRVFNYEGLYVSDGSIIPKAIGINPSRTIAAVSERIAYYILNPDERQDAQKIQVPGIFDPAQVPAGS
ncbi:MAG TPA: GMC oxidoreductase [Longimicrobiaceae bacterium]|nr:GMC oxidoreductase [Longimicrobiaceae bacterium]